MINLIKSGYTIVIFTNQSTGRTKDPEKRQKAILKSRDRIRTLLDKLHLPIFAYASFSPRDESRKPGVGMWRLMEAQFPKTESAFFVGDAAGRPADFSDSDLRFAQACGIPFHTPEDFFPIVRPLLDTKHANVVVLVGPPGVGKSQYSKDVLTPLGYDIIKTTGIKRLAELRKCFNSKKNCAIDGTNATLSDRQKVYELADDSGYQVHTIHFVRDGRWNNLRTGSDRVSEGAYHSFYKRLVPPTRSNTPGQLTLVS